MMNDRDVLTIAECAAIMRVSTQLCYQMARDGRLPAIKLGRRVMVSRAKLEKLINGETSAAA